MQTIAADARIARVDFQQMARYQKIDLRRARAVVWPHPMLELARAGAAGFIAGFKDEFHSKQPASPPPSSIMSARSATRRRPPRVHNGPAKVIRMPTPRVVRRRRAIKAGIGVLVLSLLAAIAARLFLMRSAPPAPEKVSGVTDQESEILGLVNLERARAGHRPLKFSPRLAVIARGHSYDMAIRHYLAHNSPEGIAPADRITGVGIDFKAVGENIYMADYTNSAEVPQRAMLGWLSSPDHRANIVSDKFTETGVGIARSADGSTYVTQDFVR